MMRNDGVQQASLEEAERFAGLFDGWSDDLGVAEALTLVGSIHFWAGRCAVAEEVLERATEHARRAGSRSQEAENARQLTLVISQGPLPVVEGIRRLEAMGERARGDRKVEVAVATKLGELEAMLGRFEIGEGADQPSDSARSRARRPGVVAPRAHRLGQGGDDGGPPGGGGGGGASELRDP